LTIKLSPQNPGNSRLLKATENADERFQEDGFLVLDLIEKARPLYHVQDMFGRREFPQDRMFELLFEGRTDQGRIPATFWICGTYEVSRKG
jgi:hypothetical protein